MGAFYQLSLGGWGGVGGGGGGGGNFAYFNGIKSRDMKSYYV